MTTLTQPAGDVRVYVAVARQGIPAHRPTGDGITGCGRSTRTGQLFNAADAIKQLHVTWCEQCWTPGAGLDRTPGTPDPATVLQPVPARTIWRDSRTPGRRLRVVLVTPTEVRTQWTFATTTDAWRHAARTVAVFTRAEWQQWMRRETAADLVGVR
jgi:hypothetical protein